MPKPVTGASGDLPLFILHWNRPDECLRTVEAFLAQDFPVAVKVIDNASEDEALRSLRQRLPSSVGVRRLSENKGWGPALNIVLSEWLSNSESEYCLISAHDALPGEHCVRMLMDSMDEDSHIGIACPEYGTSEIPCFSRLRYLRNKPVERRRSGTAEAVDVPHGTLMLLRKTCLKAIGLFDERYFAYGDEHELGLRARLNNWKVAIVWGAVVVNPGTWTASSTRSYLFARNSLLLIRTYGGWWSAALRFLLMIPNTVRMLCFPPSKDYAFSARARFTAMGDFLFGRYGPPPPPDR
jgi:N-acetylglucosaminyl-diphospho-decaprenol L-rhamnosyltransferase